MSHLISTEPIQNATDRRRVKERQRCAHQIAKRAIVHDERGPLTDKGQTQRGDQGEDDLTETKCAVYNEVEGDGLTVQIARPRREPKIRVYFHALCRQGA